MNLIAGRLINGSGGYTIQSDIKKYSTDNNKALNTAFIYQDDHFFSMLTVEETLYLAASLRLSTNNNHNKQAYSSNTTTNITPKKQLIHDLLDTLDLKKVTYNRVGDINKRGISGGERKRLSVASELLGHPSILLADEPTSGLDSFQAYSIMLHLSYLSKMKSMCVLCSIHQPRSSIWGLFDDILLLAEGQVVYFGPRTTVLTYFSGLGYSCPDNTNPSEFLIDLVSYNSSTVASIEESKQRIYTLITAYESFSSNFLQTRANLGSTGMSSSNSIYKPSGSDSDSAGIDSSPHYISHKPSTTHTNNHHKHNHKHNKHTKFNHIKNTLTHLPFTLLSKTKQTLHRMRHLLIRSLRQSLRDIETNLVRIVVSSVLAAIVSSVYGKPTGIRAITEASVPSRVNILAQAVVNIGRLYTMYMYMLFSIICA